MVRAAGNKKNVLITGATGFIGGFLLEELIQSGHTCRCLVRQPEKMKPQMAHPRIEIHPGDITQPDTLCSLAENVDAVFHLAAAGHVSAVSARESRRYFEVNEQGTRNLMEECGRAGVTRFIHFSSTAAMGRIKAPMIDEHFICQPETPYQKSKYAAEKTVFKSAEEYGMEAVVLRPCLVYGPGNCMEFLRVCRLIQKGMFPRIGGGRNLTPIVHVMDVVQAAANSLDNGRPGSVYLIASRTSPPLAAIRNTIAGAIGHRGPYIYLPFWLVFSGAYVLEIASRFTHRPPPVSRKNVLSVVTDRVFDISLARRDLGYEPQVDLCSGITETVAHFREMGWVGT